MVSNIPNNYNNLNDDFLYSAYKQQQNNPSEISFSANPDKPGLGVPKSRITKSGAGAAIALAAGGAGYYFANPLKNENSFKDSFVKSVNEQETINNIGKNLNQKSIKTLKKFGLDEQSYKTLYEQAKAGDSAAKAKIEQLTQVLKNNTDNIAANASKKLIDNKAAKLNFLENLKTEITGLADDVNPEELKKILKNKPEFFPKAKTAEELEQAAEKLAQNGKAGLLDNIEKISTKVRTRMNKAVENINSNTKLYDKAAKKFTKDVPETFSKVLKQFKWKNACIWSGVAACVLLAGNWIFGKENKKA